jgi:hypothetical protein
MNSRLRRRGQADDARTDATIIEILRLTAARADEASRVRWLRDPRVRQAIARDHALRQLRDAAWFGGVQ